MERLVYCILVSVLGGFALGYCQGVISGLASPLVDCVFFSDASSETQSLYQGVLAACILVGGCIGSFMNVNFANRYGRRITLLVNAFWCTVAHIALGVTTSFWGQVVLRTLIGFPVGCFGTVVPLYVGESTDVTVRGRIGCIFQVCICFSILVAQFVNYMFNMDDEDCDDMDDVDDYLFNKEPWRYQIQYGLGAVPCFLLIIVAYLCPETPVYESMAQESATLGFPNVPAMMNARKGGAGGMAAYFRPENHKWLLLAVTLAASNQITGINGIIFFSPKIFEDAGQADKKLILTMVVVGLWNFLSSLITPFFVDRFGRKPLMLFALGLMGMGSVLMAIGFAALGDSDRIGLAVPAIMMFLLGFEIGPGPLFYVLAAELFPNNIREAGLSLTSIIVWTCNLIVSFGFPIAKDVFGATATFFFFAFMCLGSWVILRATLIETKDLVLGKTDEDDEESKSLVDPTAMSFENNSTRYERMDDE
eukprot:TRINITY_DN8575_c0_g1::TRINITY_DN8575_c0_g1_i1::g.8590::m.8590 TRINITY_DN8575_c0_g1::TRINITY_DN8575_c0_g1_i1::g.8590  ORF type:complete len:491 (+),score=103.01,sp/O52733/XYLT_LACBR/27.31/4e-44,Sugar_tr/PF00083.19/3.5e-75,MFS_1/PF07690.11/46,MFS_1/PF07690.11/8.6e-17,MFS_1/PF07690.11/83,TRI12/PF06609.8/0.53,TRI12/PF06609.8/0.035 TRINITY_DN8575_c0_g1_i1:42-1475(+)